jgi:pyocin large subunit-like protein
MQGGPDSIAQWPDADYFQEHFELHRSELNVQTAAAYDRSARATIRAGRRFTYTDRPSGETRVGYYDARTRRFTALSPDERRIITHFRPDDPYYARRRPDSTY